MSGSLESSPASPVDRYDAVASGYDAGADSLRQQLLDDLTWRAIEPYLPPAGGHILDAGAGTGRAALRFLQQGYSVTLLDPSEGMLEVAKASIASKFPELPHGRVSYVVGGIDDLALPEASVDMVFSDGDPLSYCVDDLQGAAARLMRVLRQGGGFYVSCDNRWIHAAGLLSQGRFEEALVCGESGQSEDPYGNPVHAFTPQSLQALFEGAGAKVVVSGGKGILCNFMTDEMLATLASNETQKSRFWGLEQAAAQDPSLVGASAALHVMGRRGGSA